MVEARNQLVKQLMDKIYNIPDGMGGNRRPFKVRQVPAGHHSHAMA